MTARPTSGVHLFLLDDEGVVFDEFRQEVLALNTAAAAIWCLMEQGSDKAQTEHTLRAMFDLDTEQAASFTATALDDWAARGLLEGAPRRSAPMPDEPPDVPLPPYPEPAPNFVRQRHYVVRQRPLTVRFTDLAQEALIHPVLAHLEAPPAATASMLDIIAAHAGITLYRDGTPRLGCAVLEELAPMAKGLAWQFGLSKRRLPTEHACRCDRRSRRCDPAAGASGQRQVHSDCGLSGGRSGLLLRRGSAAGRGRSGGHALPIGDVCQGHRHRCTGRTFPRDHRVADAHPHGRQTRPLHAPACRARAGGRHTVRSSRLCSPAM